MYFNEESLKTFEIIVCKLGIILDRIDLFLTPGTLRPLRLH